MKLRLLFFAVLLGIAALVTVAVQMAHRILAVDIAQPSFEKGQPTQPNLAGPDTTAANTLAQKSAITPQNPPTNPNPPTHQETTRSSPATNTPAARPANDPTPTTLLARDNLNTNAPNPAPAASGNPINTTPPTETDKAAQLDANKVGEVTFLRGAASLHSPDGATTSITMGTLLHAGDRIETGPATRIQMTMIDGSIISQGERSSIRIDEYVLDTQKPQLSKSLIAMLSGACRIVTGRIAEINPGLFRVNTRLATMGIRGCDLGFKSDPKSDQFLIVDIPPSKSVSIDATVDGEPLFDLNAAKQFQVDSSSLRRIDVVDSRTLVQVTQGKGITQRTMDDNELRKFSDESTHYIQSNLRITQSANSAAITLKAPPKSQTGPGK